MAKNVSLPRGYKLNEYVIDKKISSGGFSMVYLAYTKDSVPVAIKEFFPNLLHLRSKGERIDFINAREKMRFIEGLKGFKEEADIVIRFKHHNIIECIDFFEANGTAYFVMPYEYGCTLSRFISMEKQLCEKEILQIVQGVFSAVNLLHKQGVVHLDLKPGNIWMRPNKEALILDFGTARALNDATKAKRPPMHTPGYAAPEQHREFYQPQRLGAWTDYYGLGATLCALIERKTPSPSSELLSNGKTTKLVDKRIGQFSRETLEIVEELMQTDWNKRKAIDLDDIINRLGKIRPPGSIPLFEKDLDVLLREVTQESLV